MSDLTSHWRKSYENKYLGAWDLYDGKRYREVRARILKVTDEIVIGEGGRKSRPVQLHLAGRKGPIETPMIVSKTSGKTLEILFGPVPADWVGQEITLHVIQGKRVQKGTGNVLAIKCDKNARGEDMPEPARAPAIAADEFEDDQNQSGARQPGED